MKSGKNTTGKWKKPAQTASLVFTVFLIIAGYALSAKAGISLFQDKPTQSSQISWPGIPEGSVEIAADRTENTKKFLAPDGTAKYVVGSGPFHFYDGSAWQEIDTTVRPSTSQAADYEMTRSIYKAWFKKEFSAGRLLKLEKDNASVDISAGDLYWTDSTGTKQLVASPQTVEGTANGSTVTYKNAYGNGFDFLYQTADQKLSKRLIISNFKSLPKPTSNLSNSSDLSLALEVSFSHSSDLEINIGNKPWNGEVATITGERIEFKRGEKLLWYFAPPVGWDSTGVQAEGSAILKNVNGQAQLTLLFPYSWLSETSGQITLDPDTYYGATTDGYVYGVNSASDYAAARNTSTGFDSSSTTILSVGQSLGGRSGTTYSVYRTFLEFDTSAINGTITQANLYLKPSAISSASGLTVRVHKYGWTSPIDATNREANYDGALASTYDANWQSSGSVSVGTYYGSSNLDTSYVNDAGTTQYALLSNEDVSNSAPAADDYIQFYTHDNATSTNRPYLSITMATPTISGTVYTTEAKDANVGTNVSVGISVNGGAKTTTFTTNGAFAFTEVPVSANDTIFLFVDDHGSYEANYVTQAVSSGADITGIEMYTNKIVLSHQTAGPMTNTLLATADNSGDDDIHYTFSGSDITFEAGYELWINAGKTFTPGAAVTVDDLQIEGTLSFASNANNLVTSGNILIGTGGVFTKGTGTWHMGGTSKTFTDNSSSGPQNLGVVQMGP